MYENFIKRFLDFVLALLGLPFLIIILLIFMPIIWFTDRGPVFYNASRMGKNGKRFTMFKLRSMKVNAADLRNPDGSTFNSENDPRVTPIGRFIRKTSIDELPQLLNVLFGDMSFVGPRPSLYSNKYNTFDDVKKKRFKLRPGITGYVQAHYRNSIGLQERYRYDAWYVENISFILDFKILIKTFLSVVKRENVFVPTGNK